jgi:hypothetical protein
MARNLREVIATASAERRAKVAAAHRQKLIALKRKRQLEEARRVMALDRHEKLRDYIAPRLKDEKLVKETNRDHKFGAKFEVCHPNGFMLVGFGVVVSNEPNNVPKYELYTPSREPWLEECDYPPPVDVTRFLDFEKLAKAVLRKLSDDLN